MDNIYYQNPDIRTIMSVTDLSIKELENLCAENDAEAMYVLGRRYVSGDGTDKDSAKGRMLLSRSANAGNTDAMMAMVDDCLEEQPEGWTSFVEHYLRKAIAAGNDAAIIKLADYYYLGEGNSNKHAALLYVESARRKEDDCEREVSILNRMLESGWLDEDWKFYKDALEVLADNGNREARHALRREEIPEPTDEYDFEALVNEVIEIPVMEEEKPKARRQWGRTVGKRDLTSLLYDMGIEFTRSSNGIIKTKKGREIEEQINQLIARGYKFKYSYKSDKWTIADKKKSE